jgi:hypothetical protein
LDKSTSITLLYICLVTSVISYAAAPEQTEVIPLTKQDDIRHASSMDQAIGSLSTKVMECVRGKLAQDSECFCHYPQELSRVRKTYESTIKRHPEWRNKVVSYTQEGKTFAVSFGGVSRQLEIKCLQSG